MVYQKNCHRGILPRKVIYTRRSNNPHGAARTFTDVCLRSLTWAFAARLAALQAHTLRRIPSAKRAEPSVSIPDKPGMLLAGGDRGMLQKLTPSNASLSLPLSILRYDMSSFGFGVRPLHLFVGQCCCFGACLERRLCVCRLVSTTEITSEKWLGEDGANMLALGTSAWRNGTPLQVNHKRDCLIRGLVPGFWFCPTMHAVFRLQRAS